MRFDLALQLSAIGERVAVEFLFDRFEDFTCRFDAQVSGEERGLEGIENRRINPALTQKNIVYRFRERSLGLADGRFQAFEKAGFFLFFFAKERNHWD